MEGSEAKTVGRSLVNLVDLRFGEDCLKELSEVLKSGRITRGEKTEEVESMLKRLTGRRYARCVSSGTSGLWLALKGLGVEPGDKVAIPEYTYAAVLNSVVACGSDPVFCYHDENLQPTPPLHENKVKAAIVAGSYGRVPNMRKWLKWGARFGVPIIEDAAESFCGDWEGKPAGSWGDVSIFSFHANKIVTSGEGGAIFTDSERIMERVTLLSKNGVEDDFLPKIHGINCKWTEMQAAVLLPQLRELPYILEARGRIEDWYSELFDDQHFEAIVPKKSVERKAPWMTPVMVNAFLNKVMNKLEKSKIETRPFFPSLRMFWEHGSTEKNVNGILLPCHPYVTEEDVEKINKCFQESRF